MINFLIFNSFLDRLFIKVMLYLVILLGRGGELVVFVFGGGYFLLNVFFFERLGKWFMWLGSMEDAFFSRD